MKIAYAADIILAVSVNHMEPGANVFPSFKDCGVVSQIGRLFAEVS